MESSFVGALEDADAAAVVVFLFIMEITIGVLLKDAPEPVFLVVGLGVDSGDCVGGVVGCFPRFLARHALYVIS